MSRSKKSRSMKDRIGVKTGSKKDFIKQGEKGKIPSHNRLAKHKKRQKSAYQQFLEDNNMKDTTSGQQAVKQRLKEAEETVSTSTVETETEKPKESAKDFNQLSGDELLDLFNN